LLVVGSATSLYALVPPTSTQPNGCLSHSTNLGKEWSPCSGKAALNCTAANACNQLIIKDSKTMFMMRKVRMKQAGLSSLSHETQPHPCCTL
jgi:hypothetical protein